MIFCISDFFCYTQSPHAIINFYLPYKNWHYAKFVMHLIGFFQHEEKAILYSKIIFNNTSTYSYDNHILYSYMLRWPKLRVIGCSDHKKGIRYGMQAKDRKYHLQITKLDIAELWRFWNAKKLKYKAVWVYLKLMGWRRKYKIRVHWCVPVMEKDDSKIKYPALWSPGFGAWYHPQLCSLFRIHLGKKGLSLRGHLPYCFLLYQYVEWNSPFVIYRWSLFCSATPLDLYYLWCGQTLHGLS